MLNKQIFGRLQHFKRNVQDLWGKLSEHDFESSRKKLSKMQKTISGKSGNNVSPDQIHIDNYQYESHRTDDLPLTIIKDPGPGIKYSYTENSEFARGAEKAEAVGIDSFGEEDTFDPDEADEHQDYRNRTHKSDLSDRYFTHGMNIRQDDLKHH